ncbi:MAG: hypothetical protein JNL92_07410 [Opitutaceae bacterium]|nr:hypothetical protein [Opitutaceae bacterium]
MWVLRARCAGLPPRVIARAKTIPVQLESDDVMASSLAHRAKPRTKITAAPEDAAQLSFL